MKLKIFFVSLLDILVMIAPVTVWILLNREKYFLKAEGVKLSFGCILALIVIILSIKGKIKGLDKLWGFLIVTVIVFFLDSIIQDAKYILCLATIGVAFDSILFAPILKNMKIRLEKEREGTTIGTAIAKAMIANKPPQEEEIGNV